jgi:photosystem II stability/assembly factor-like uncharacterized protein
MISNYSTDDSLVGLFRSTDQGATWQHQLSGNGYILKGTKKNMLLFVTENNKIYITIDDGKSWVLTALKPTISYGSAIGATDEYIFFFNGSYISRYSIVDGTLTSIASASTGVLIASDLLVAYSGSRLIASNDFNRWDTLRQITDNIVSISRADGDKINVIANDNSGKVYNLISSDRGITWDSIAIPIIHNTSYTFSLNCTNPSKYFYDDGGGISTSIDKGSSWQKIGMPYASIIQLFVSSGKIFVNPRQQYIQGVLVSQAAISSDNGYTWQQNDNQNIQIIELGSGPNGSIIAIGTISPSDPAYSILVYDSTAPSHWKRRSTVQEITGSSILASDSKYIYVAHGESIFQSDDNGLTWVALNVPNTGNQISSLAVSSGGVIYFGSAPAMYRSDDLGATWIKLRPVNDPVELISIKPFGSTGVLLGTQGDGLLISSDKGSTWSRLDGNNFDTVNCIGIDSKGTIAAGTNRGLWIYDQVKQIWSKIPLGQDNDLNITSIDVSASNDFYIGTVGSGVWIGSTTYSSVSTPFINNSEMKISPDPASGMIMIDLPHSEHIKLEIFDLLGRRISVIADGKNPPAQQLNFSTSNLANGVYTLVLSGDKNETQKLVVRH